MAVASGNYPDKNDRRYISAAMDAPMLERDYEVQLARRWREEGDANALHEIIEAHIPVSYTHLTLPTIYSV